MPFDQPTRNRLARFVADVRGLLTEEFTRQLQNEYGLDPATGAVTDLARLTHLDDARRATARILRATLDHYQAMLSATGAKARQEALDRIVREQAFTVLNRLCALRMAEARGLLIESIARGYQSKGFLLYARLAGNALGETGDAYRAYLFSLFDEFAVDLAVLFDRFSPQGRLFPGESAFLRVLAQLNHPDIDALWAEDETIGWIYQYFNSKEERKAMRDASQAPRNSRELAVRNQFFTPRYVVEFLTDNTLGRIWYEMTKGATSLKESCRYLVRRPTEIFLNDPDDFLPEDCRPWVRRARSGDFSDLPDDPTEEELASISLAFNGYEVAERLGGYGNVLDWARHHLEEFEKTDVVPALSPDLWFLLFALQRQWRVITGSGPVDDKFLSLWRRVYLAWRAALQSDSAELSQEELLRQPVYIPHRPLKDPREITMLDPACGSMHFGLYAFDLFEHIYEEAWDLQASGQWPISQSHQSPNPQSLIEAYPTKEALLRDLPRLILEHNIHGVDIDPRAVQIAGLSLWLRAQRNWQAQGVKAQDRPQIRRSNIVCAEPMPGETAMLAEFAAGLQPPVLGQLVQVVFEKMKLAGEAGSLLKIEEELAGAVAEAKRKWLALGKPEQGRLFADDAPKQMELELDLSGISDERFWGHAEVLVLAALREYAEQAENGDSYQRRLFAGDAALGFAFIDLCRKRYDVVLMNPPFGEPTKAIKAYIGVKYPRTKNDIYASFVEEGVHRQIRCGRLGAITSRTGFFLSSFQKWREEIILRETTPVAFADLGYGVLDAAMVETAAYILEARA